MSGFLKMLKFLYVKGRLSYSLNLGFHRCFCIGHVGNVISSVENINLLPMYTLLIYCIYCKVMAVYIEVYIDVICRILDTVLKSTLKNNSQ